MGPSLEAIHTLGCLFALGEGAIRQFRQLELGKTVCNHRFELVEVKEESVRPDWFAGEVKGDCSGK